MVPIKKIILYCMFLALILSFFCCKRTTDKIGTLHILEIHNSNDLRDFFQYTGNDIPLISGHRGGVSDGYPENSIETFENVLKHTSAFFEVDPRLSKDSIIVLMHDATLERTTTGKGKVSDFTLEELKQLRLKDSKGNITEYQIPTLEEAIQWSMGKTILNLDKKDVPMTKMAKVLRKYDTATNVMLTVHNAEQAKFYHNENNDRMFSAFIKTEEEFEEYNNSGVPWSQMIAYIGPKIKGENKKVYDLLHAKGVMCMISAASSYDKLEKFSARKKAYVNIVKDGADILESDLPIDAAHEIEIFRPENSPKAKYFSKEESISKSIKR